MPESAELHRWVELYNWDDGLAPIWPIVESANTEYATALLIYWRLEGPFTIANREGANLEARQLLDLIADRLLSGYYRKGALRYDPVTENRLSKTQVHKLKKAGLPNELIEPDYSTATSKP